MNKKKIKTLALWLFAISIFAINFQQPEKIADAAKAPTANHMTYLPMILAPNQTSSVPPPPTTARRVNAPNFAGNISFEQTAIFWFGKLTPTENYADVRVGYNNDELYVYVAAFDRRIFYDTTPSVADLNAWDAVTLYLNLNGNTGTAPSANAFRFDSQFSWSEPRANYQTAYRGNGSTWAAASTPFTTSAGWRGDAPNNDIDDRGWVMTFHIPFASLGITAPTAQTMWGMAVVLHDRDDATGTMIADKTWPETLSPNTPSTWGQLVFGLPAFTPPSATPRATVTVRQGLNGAIVKDGAVGGSTVCGSGLDFWTQWGNQNYAGGTEANIQNQSDIADWPCYSKYYVAFPLAAIPASKKIVSATLTLHQMGNSGGAGQAQPSLIQVMTVNEDWNETALTWNNAPLAAENVSQAWVDLAPGCGSTVSWPCYARTWNVSRAVTQAYATGKPLSIVLYSADNNYHSGKYFTTSDSGDWNATGRPTLDVQWGD